MQAFYVENFLGVGSSIRMCMQKLRMSFFFLHLFAISLVIKKFV